MSKAHVPFRRAKFYHGRELKSQELLMKSLSREDQLHLNAAIGWMDLGNCLEAYEELEKITLTSRVHPDVLEVRWKIYAAAKKWDASQVIAETLCDIAPERITSWFFLAFTLYHSISVTRSDLLVRE
jgi:hypothetical protein